MYAKLSLGLTIAAILVVIPSHWAELSAQPVDKKLAKKLQQIAKTIKPSSYSDGEIAGATVEGRDVILRINLPVGVDAQLARQTELSEKFAAGFCLPQTVDGMSRLQIGHELRYFQGGVAVGTARMDVPACHSYWKRAMALAQVLPSQQDVPVFEFKGIVAGKPADLGSFNTCNGTISEILNCSIADGSAGGVTLFPSFKLYRAMLSSMNATVYISDYKTLKRALEAKYGPATSESSSSWQNKAGAVFDNLTTSWVFRTGTLSLIARGQKIDEGELIYVDSNAPPEAPPVIDF